MKLLVSVRSANEALAALAGGCDLIDVKEPANGPLGQANERVIEEIWRIVAGRVPVSAAFGELKNVCLPKLPFPDLEFMKVGLAGCQGNEWCARICELRVASPHQIVPAAYADCAVAEAPTIQEVVGFVIAERFPVLLIDTFEKCGRTLFDHLSVAQLRHWADQLRTAGIQLALAGSLTEKDVPSIRSINPTWMAVRGAVCGGSNRLGQIEATPVRSLKALVSR